jgi:hypothetical protein
MMSLPKLAAAALLFVLAPMAPSASRAGCCELALEAPDQPVAAPLVVAWYPPGTYYNGLSLYYAPRGVIVPVRTPSPAPVRIHGWPACSWGPTHESRSGYHWVGPRLGFCD